MSRPYKHPKTGVYYFRKVVPDDLREFLGKREEKISLRTKSPVIGIAIKLDKKAKFRPKGFTDEEALTLLKDARNYRSERKHS